jgi:ammonium transporter
MEINMADTTFMFLATVMVLLMTPALSLFYGGMVRAKNVLSTTMHSYAAIVVVVIQWIILGYSLSFGGDNSIIGDFSFAFLKNVGFAPVDYAPTIPHQLFMMFQLAFAIITPAIISGSVAERMKFPAYLAFVLLWTTLVYDPIAHWVWGNGGWIREMGALDFAGGTVIHVSAGISALVAAIFVGNRTNKDSVRPHNIPMTMIGAGLLLFGWFGFNAGSALSINGIAMNAFITTTVSGAAAGFSWLMCEWVLHKRPTALGLVSGIIAGLGSITQSAGYVSPFSALLIGFVGGILCFFAVTELKKRIGYDDALDAFGCHGVGGIWGGISAGIFATSTINPDITGGLVDGNMTLLIVEIISIVAVTAYSAIISFVILKLISLVMPVRASEEEEEDGMDYSLHGETAYGSVSAAGLAVGAHDAVAVPASPAIFPKKQFGTEVVAMDEAVVVENHATALPSNKAHKTGKMTKVEILINESKFDHLKKALNGIGITGMTVVNVFGYGVQKGHTTYYRGVETDADLLPKVRVEVVISNVPLQQVIETARKALYTGNIGDGKIFVYDVENVIRVSTGEEGAQALAYNGDAELLRVNS